MAIAMTMTKTMTMASRQGSWEFRRQHGDEMVDTVVQVQDGIYHGKAVVDCDL